ncbi:Cyclin-dependent kinase G-2 [Hibiscus syriacus]|uniref:Cyclin-dependent kinase G-2 n=1 Tax=Hibiscus syriacus TaxID=106335 RepID=A0A6A2XTQ6_HIBSY|nr:Cyclin-dependent kinase G-2 [Hibiscus syriacus]
MAAGRVDVWRRIDVEKVNRDYVHANPVKDVCNYPSNTASEKTEVFFNCMGPRKLFVQDRVIATTNTLSSPPSPLKLSNTVSNQDDKKLPVSADLIKEEHSPPESPVSNFGAALSPSLSGWRCQGDEQEKDLMGKENFQAPNLFTSRWASDDNDEDGSLTEEKIRSSSLESGEFEREELEGDGVQSDERSNSVLYACKGEDKGCKLDSDNVMDFDDMREEDAIFDQSDLDVEEYTGSGMNMLLGSRSVFEYERLNKISEEYGFPVTSLREINILASFHHPSIVKVKEVVVDDRESVYMVMEYMEHDLKWLMDSMKRRFSTSDVKSLMLQLLEGVKYLHDNWVLHRDLKTSNLLLNNQGELKICDFGMARLYGSPLKPYTTKVVTQWYRAPELLLGAKKYSTAVDMWSVGCIMAELLAKEPLFKGTSEIDQLHKIYDTLSVPNEKVWPGFSELPGAKANYSKQLLLTYDPEKRITADDALNHDWFRELPLAKSKEFFPTFPPKV